MADRTPQGDPNLPRYGNNGFKRNGWLGPIPVEGGYATEYSMGVPILGKETEIPTLVPGLDPEELKALVNAINTQGQLPDSVVKKAVDHATLRAVLGQSPFAGDNESPVPTRSPGPWRDEYVFADPKPTLFTMLRDGFLPRR